MFSSMHKLTGKLHDREKAIRSFTECVALPSGTPTRRINATFSVTSILEEDMNRADTSEIAKIAVNLLPLVSSQSQRQKGQQHGIMQYAGLATRAAAASLQAENELLMRCSFWNSVEEL
jgi:hypothetical protein